MADYLGVHLDRARAALRRDDDAPLLHPLAGAVEDGRISRKAAIGIAATMFAAGGESTAALIGNMVRCLAEHPESARVLRESRELLPRFVEEVARSDPPFNFHYRVGRSFPSPAMSRSMRAASRCDAWSIFSSTLSPLEMVTRPIHGQP